MNIKKRISNFISYLSSDEVDDSIENDQSEGINAEDYNSTSSQQLENPYDKKTQEVSTRVERVNVKQSQVKQNMEHRDNKLENSQQTTIALKFPKKYEDAREIVDLLLNNECVLIDFQYMLDAQARRCIDFIDGASKVLDGKLRKIGGSMFLLTPPNIIVDIEELSSVNANQDFGFDFDMKVR